MRDAREEGETRGCTSSFPPSSFSASSYPRPASSSCLLPPLTLLLTPSRPLQEEEYNALLAAHETIMSSLVDGASIAAVAEKAVQVRGCEGGWRGKR